VGFEMLAGELPFLAPTVPGILLKQITEARRRSCANAGLPEISPPA